MGAMQVVVDGYCTHLICGDNFSIQSCSRIGFSPVRLCCLKGDYMNRSGIACAMGLMGLLTVCSQFGTGGVPSVNLEAEQTSIRNADMEWSKAATAKNIDQVISYYAEDASVFVPNEQIATGIPAIKSEWTKMMALPGFSLNWIPTRVDVAKSGDMGYSFGNYNLSVS